MLERLHAHREWANQRILDWVFALPHPDEYFLKMLSHILMAEGVWLCRIRGESNPDFSRKLLAWETLSVEELKSRSAASNAGWQEVLQSDVSRTVRYFRFTGEACDSVVSDMATHVCTHGVYHRGQIAAHAARLGLKCPPTDFIVFSR